MDLLLTFWKKEKKNVVVTKNWKLKKKRLNLKLKNKKQPWNIILLFGVWILHVFFL